MKKKLFLLAVFVLALISFYDVKAAACRIVTVEYVNMDNLYNDEKYITYRENNIDGYVHKIVGEITYVMYGNSYEIKNKKITGLNSYCKYSECYKDIVGKYAIIVNLEDEELAKVPSPLDLIDFSYYNANLKKIETTEETKYTYTRFSFKQINGEQLLPEVQCWKNDSICKETVGDDKVEIDIESVKKEIPDYKFNSYKIYKFKEGEFEETDYIARECGKYVIRLYYQKTKQESNETVNMTKTKNIKMKSYFKDLEGITTKINYRVLDTSIAEIDSEGNIKPLKVGETDIIAEAAGIEYTLHLKVTEDMIKSPDITNPATSSTIAIVLGMISSLILVTVYFKMTKERHE